MTELSRDRCSCCRVLFSLGAECLVVLGIIVHLLVTTTQLLVQYEIIAPREDSSSGNGVTTVVPKVNDTGQGTCDPRPSHDVVAVVVEVFQYVSLAISAVFLLEIIFKMVFLRKRFFKDPWMVFDLLVILASLSVEILLFVDVVCYSTGIGAAAYVIFLRLWRIPRTCNIRKKEYRGRLEDEIRYLTQTKMETELKYKHMEQTCHKHEAELQRISALLQKHNGLIEADSGETKLVANGTSLADKLTAQFTAGRESVELGTGNHVSHDEPTANNTPTQDRSTDFAKDEIVSGVDKAGNSDDKNVHNDLERNDSDVNSKANDSGIEVKDSFRSDKVQGGHVKSYRADNNVFDDSDSEAPPAGEASVQEVRVQIEDPIHQKKLPSISRSINEEEQDEGQVVLRRKASKSKALGVTNAAFVADGDDIDGTKTYRSIDGTPMTDL